MPDHSKTESHPSAEQLVAFHNEDENLTSADRDTVAHHLQDCTGCQSDLAALRSFDFSVIQQWKAEALLAQSEAVSPKAVPEKRLTSLLGSLYTLFLRPVLAWFGKRSTKTPPLVIPNEVVHAYGTLIADLTRDLIAQLAPQELPLVRQISEAFLIRPERILHSQSAHAGGMEFDREAEKVNLLTPPALVVITAVFQMLETQRQQGMPAEHRSESREAVRRVFKKFRPGESQSTEYSEALTQDQATAIYTVALEKAKQLDLPPEQAEELAEAIVESLVVVDE